jgi:hypothetical protein
MSFYAQSGTYNYTVLAANYTASPQSGTVTVNGQSPPQVSINFTNGNSTKTNANATTSCSNPVNPTAGREGPCIIVSASQCVNSPSICPNDTTPTYDVLTLQFAPASNYYEVLTDAQVSSITSNVSAYILNSYKIPTQNFLNADQNYKEIVTNNTSTSTQDALKGIDLSIYVSQIASIVVSASAESEGSALVGAGMAATKVSTEYPCHDSMSALVNTVLYTDIAAQEATANTTVIAELKDGHVGLSGSNGGPDLDYTDSLLIATPYEQFDVMMKLSGNVISDQLPVSGAGYVFTNNLGSGSLTPTTRGAKSPCITTLRTANFSQSVNVGST